jgi:hypothetical protein
MTRLCNILSSVFGCVAVVLLVLGVLTVSPYAWADNGCSSDSDCGSGYTCSSGICYPIAGINCGSCNQTGSSCPGHAQPCGGLTCVPDNQRNICIGCWCYPWGSLCNCF